MFSGSRYTHRKVSTNFSLTWKKCALRSTSRGTSAGRCGGFGMRCTQSTVRSADERLGRVVRKTSLTKHDSWDGVTDLGIPLMLKLFYLDLSSKSANLDLIHCNSSEWTLMCIYHCVEGGSEFIYSSTWHTLSPNSCNSALRWCKPNSRSVCRKALRENNISFVSKMGCPLGGKEAMGSAGPVSIECGMHALLTSAVSSAPLCSLSPALS